MDPEFQPAHLVPSATAQFKPFVWQHLLPGAWQELPQHWLPGPHTKLLLEPLQQTPPGPEQMSPQHVLPAPHWNFLPSELVQVTESDVKAAPRSLRQQRSPSALQTCPQHSPSPQANSRPSLLEHIFTPQRSNHWLNHFVTFFEAFGGRKAMSAVSSFRHSPSMHCSAGTCEARIATTREAAANCFKAMSPRM